MKFISTIKNNKRGKPYTSRPTKLANGFMKHYGNNSKTMTDEMRRIAVYGTLDNLAKQRFDIIWITVTHPIDKDYTKRVAILRKNKAKYIQRMPLESRMKTEYKSKLN
jgi:hypothetical protein